ncbi:MAG: polysaccharide pyruvyl transferase family protein [bacterium]
MRSLVVAGEYYSENLGDGVITETLRYLLQQVDPELEVKIVDLSHRTEFCATPPSSIIRATGRFSRLLSWLFKACIPDNRKRTAALYSVMWRFREQKSHQHFFMAELAGASALIIGGGQLLMDNSLVFPYRINSATRCALRLGIPVAFQSCGVGSNWSAKGRRLFAGALCPAQVVSISVRDNDSVEELQAELPKIAAKVTFAIDPAICAGEAYGVNRSFVSKTIGLGVIAPGELLSHPTYAHLADETSALERWVALIRHLAGLGYPLALFTNGSVVDYHFAEKVLKTAQEDGICNISLACRPQLPHELVELIAQYRAVIAYRLHANIIATSLKVPSLGFIWDEKVRQFGHESGRSAYYLEPDKVNMEVIATKLAEICSNSYPDTEINELKSVALENVKYTLQQLGMIN